MPAKKTIKKKTTKKNVPVHKHEHFHFLTILVLFTGFTVYALLSFFMSTNDYIDNYYVSVLAVPQDLDIVASAPPECQTCPPFPICAPVCGAATVDEPYEIFSDVMSNHRNAVAIEALYKLGIVNGYGDGSFKPENTLNRAELLTVLTNAIDADFSGGSYDNCFTDVGTEWFAPFVCYAKVSGWVNGFTDGSYRPAQTVNKAEALKITLEAFNYDVPDFVDVAPYTDVSVTDWYAPYAELARDAGIVDGGAFFSAAYELSRAEFVEMVYRAMKFKGLI